MNLTSTPAIDRELSLIKSNFDRELGELKRAVSADILAQLNQHESNSCNTSMSSLADYDSDASSASSIASVKRQLSVSSIKSLRKWNEDDREEAVELRLEQPAAVKIIDDSQAENVQSGSQRRH